MDIKNLISIDDSVLGGQPVFHGTRVSIDTLFDHLESGFSLEDFLEDFPSVSREQAVAVLEVANRLLHSKDIVKLYETAA